MSKVKLVLREPKEKPTTKVRKDTLDRKDLQVLLLPRVTSVLKVKRAKPTTKVRKVKPMTKGIKEIKVRRDSQGQTEPTVQTDSKVTRDLELVRKVRRVL